MNTIQRAALEKLTKTIHMYRPFLGFYFVGNLQVQKIYDRYEPCFGCEGQNYGPTEGERGKVGYGDAPYQKTRLTDIDSFTKYVTHPPRPPLYLLPVGCRRRRRTAPGRRGRGGGGRGGRGGHASRGKAAARLMMSGQPTGFI